MEINGKEYYDYSKLTTSAGMIRGYKVEDIEPTGILYF